MIQRHDTRSQQQPPKLLEQVREVIRRAALQLTH